MKKPSFDYIYAVSAAFGLAVAFFLLFVVSVWTLYGPEVLEDYVDWERWMDTVLVSDWGGYEQEAEDEFGRVQEIVVVRPTDIGTENNPRVIDYSPDPEEEQEEEDQDNEAEEREVLEVERPLFQYIEVTESCGYDFEGGCVNVRSGPGTDFPVVNQLRNGQVLKVGGVVEREERRWYRIVFHEWLRYPDRVTSDWYVAEDFIQEHLNEGIQEGLPPSEERPDKRIVVSRADQTLRAYEGGELFMERSISTGLKLTPTPAGTFAIFRKMPSRYMQGPLPGISTRFWDLPGVPWVLYFTHGGAAIHGTFWHDDFGSAASAGCVNLPPDDARKLYHWADLGTQVIVE